MPLRGHCNCQAIKVTVADDPPDTDRTVYCHCQNCQRQSSGTGSCIMVVKDANVRVDGNPKFYLDTNTTSGTPMKRWFCRDCGSPIMSTTPIAAGKTFVKMGLFDDIPAPAIEQFVKRRQRWAVSFPSAASQFAGDARLG